MSGVAIRHMVARDVPFEAFASAIVCIEVALVGAIG
jgi:hypothetical protein